MRHDWQGIREQYVCGRMTLQELAAANHVSFSAVKNKAAAEKWSEQREEFQAEVSKKARASAARRRGKREADVLLQVEDACEALVARITAALEDEDLFYRHIVNVKNSEQGERVFKVINAKNMRELVATLGELQALIARHGDILDKRTKDELKLKRDRLKLDREKAGLTNNGNDTETGVTFLPYVDEGQIDIVDLSEAG